MRRLIGGVLALGACAMLFPSAAGARPAYLAAFQKTYKVKPGGNLEKAGCNICHMGQDKKVRNPYGKDVEKALGKSNATPDEAGAAIKKIEKMVGGDKKTKYVDLIKADKLPGDAKK